MINAQTGYVEDDVFLRGMIQIQADAVKLLDQFKHIKGKEFKYLGFVLADSVGLAINMHTTTEVLRKHLESQIENSTE
jgi:hypothetical protein